ncbi:hypothetical protein ACWDZ4_20095 [Streptomyces sp. NPDC003016]
MAFATGDRIFHRACTLERLASGTWASVECGPMAKPKTDAKIRELFVNPARLAALGVPLFSPAHVPADAPLPGRPVADGENPYRVGHAYLLCVTPGAAPNHLAGIPTVQPGPWGTAQAAFLATATHKWGKEFEVSLTETGTIYLRLPDLSLTFAYVPAEDPTDQEAIGLVAYATLLSAFPRVVTAALDRL